MMFHQPLRPEFMQQCGSSLLRALQNDSMVPLDLLVRESVQNSLDAAISDTRTVNVEFSIRTHRATDIAGVLDARDGLSKRLISRFAGPQRLLEIRDSNTTGLTGPLRLEELSPGESHGNLLKLVYEIGRSQGDERAGGSWGLGKTVYFRMGIGLVFYYSRIRESSGAYAERLAACLVEDEGRPDRIQESSLTGISWWGARPKGPLTNPAEIAPVLAALGVRRYSGEETGTTIIIPFLRDDLRPDPVQEAEGDDAGAAQGSLPWWCLDDEAYIHVAVQRWYCVRLENPHFFGGPPLSIKVGGKTLGRHEMLPIFRIAQGLYNRAAHTNLRTPDFLAHVAPTLTPTVEEVGRLNETLDGSRYVGRVAMAKLTAEHLGLAPPHNHLSPMQALYGREIATPWRPVVGFLRSHGMIVRWDNRSEDGGWSRGVPPSEDGLLLAIFVPFGSMPLHPKLVSRLKRPHRTLEAFLRGCELADHHQWKDPSGITVVARIRACVAQRLRALVVPPDQTSPGSVPLHAARTIADRLLPDGFGRDGRSGVPSSHRGHAPPPISSKGKGPSLQVRAVRHGAGTVSVDWRVTWRRVPSTCVLRVGVASEGPLFSVERWHREAAGPFPLAIVGAELVGASASEGAPARAMLSTTPDGAGLVLEPGRVTSKGALSVDGSMTIRVFPPEGATIQPVLSISPKEGSVEGAL